MELEKAFRFSAKSEIAYISGALRVTIEHGFNPFRLVLDAVISAWVAWGEWGSWSRGSWFSKLFIVFVTVGVLGDLAYQLTGSEIIEFSAQGLKIQLNYFGWQRIREYPTEKCSELSWQPEEGRKGEYALECKVGWRKVRFGKYVSAAQAGKSYRSCSAICRTSHRRWECPREA